MKPSVKPSKEPQTIKKTGRFATAEEAAQAKNANLVAHIKKLGITAEKLKSSAK